MFIRQMFSAYQMFMFHHPLDWMRTCSQDVSVCSKLYFGDFPEEIKNKEIYLLDLILVFTNFHTLM